MKTSWHSSCASAWLPSRRKAVGVDRPLVALDQPAEGLAAAALGGGHQALDGGDPLGVFSENGGHDFGPCFKICGKTTSVVLTLRREAFLTAEREDYTESKASRSLSPGKWHRASSNTLGRAEIRRHSPTCHSGAAAAETWGLRDVSQ